MKSRRSTRRPSHGIHTALASLVMVAAVARGVPDAEARSARYPRAAGTVVASLTETPGEVAAGDQATVHVYGDGRVVVHKPRYTRQAGDYTLRLAPGELDALVQSLADAGILDFDEATVGRAQRAAAARGTPGGTVSFDADATTTTIELRLDRGARRVSRRGLAAEVRAYPGVTPLRNLAAARDRLRALTERPDLRRVEVTP
jgi:hypothetical protein